MLGFGQTSLPLSMHYYATQQNLYQQSHFYLLKLGLKTLFVMLVKLQLL